MFKFAPRDKEFFLELRRNPLLTNDQFARLLNRSERCVRRRTKAFKAEGYLLPFHIPDPNTRSTNPGYAHFAPTRKGWAEMLAFGFLKELLGMGERTSSKNLKHDFILSEFYVRLREVQADIKEWERIPRYLRYGKHTADGFLTVGQAVGFVEVQRSNSATDNGSMMDKVAAYDEYFESGQFADKFGTDGRVYIIRNTHQEAVNLAKQIAKCSRRPRRYFVTHTEPLFKKPLGHIWITGEDYATRSYDIEGKPVKLDTAQDSRQRADVAPPVSRPDEASGQTGAGA